MTEQQVDNQTAELAEKIKPILIRGGVVSAALFGSQARGEAKTDSDLDLLVEYKDGTTLLDVAGLKAELEKELDRPVDLVSKKYLHHRIRERVLNEQIPIL